MTNFRKDDFIDLALLIATATILVVVIVWLGKTLFNFIF